MKIRNYHFCFHPQTSARVHGDEYGVDQVKEEDDGVMALGEGRTRIYMGDVGGIGRVKKERRRRQAWWRSNTCRYWLVMPGEVCMSEGLLV
jgi:hypothetical protein